MCEPNTLKYEILGLSPLMTMHRLLVIDMESCFNCVDLHENVSSMDHGDIITSPVLTTITINNSCD